MSTGTRATNSLPFIKCVGVWFLMKGEKLDLISIEWDGKTINVAITRGKEMIQWRSWMQILTGGVLFAFFACFDVFVEWIRSKAIYPNVKSFDSKMYRQRFYVKADIYISLPFSFSSSFYYVCLPHISQRLTSFAKKKIQMLCKKSQHCINCEQTPSAYIFFSWRKKMSRTDSVDIFFYYLRNKNKNVWR